MEEKSKSERYPGDDRGNPKGPKGVSSWVKMRTDRVSSKRNKKGEAGLKQMPSHYQSRLTKGRSNSLSRSEILQELLLQYMKLTIALTKKKLLEGNKLTSDEYSASTDNDSGEEPAGRKVVTSRHTYQCDQCSKILRGIHSLKNHCKRKHGSHNEKNVLCDKCPTRFFTDFEFNRHYQTHFSVKNYLCHLCSKKFVQKSTLELHLRYHRNDRRYQCDQCQKKFFTNNHLKRHCLTHTNQRDFECVPCNRSFRYKDHLRRHLQNVHIGVRAHTCGVCHKSFMYLSQLKFHEQSHTKVPCKCRYCSQTFRNKVSVKVHEKQCREKTST